ncbi:unnamed protein product [Symbiodinium sp. CCMP2592]|nr:unnamed protein product [Symbiodinium sp. CCMP2592]
MEGDASTGMEVAEVPAPSDRPRSTSPGWQVVGKGKRGPKGSPGKGKGGPSNDAPPRRVSFQAPVEQSPPQTQVEATLLAQLKALVTQCEATGTKGLLSKLKALAQGGGKSRKDAQGPQGQQSWAIDTKWWPGVLSSAATLDQSLEEGEEPGDNVAATVTLEQAKALMGLAKVHELKSKVALIIKDWHGPKAPEGLTATKTWIRLADSKWKEVWTTALAQDLPTWGSVPKVVECKTVPEQIKQATLKVIIPKAFQPPCDWDELCRKPASAVRTLLPEALSVRSYGWHLLEQRDEAICGFLKLPADKSPLVLANSGAKGFFVKRIDGQADPGQRVPIKWIPHNKLKAQAYFALAKREADKAKTSLAYRSGGGSCLGLIGIPAGENGSEAALLKREIDMDEKRGAKNIRNAGNAMRQGAVSTKVQEKIAKVALSLRTKATDWLENNQGAWVLEWYSEPFLRSQAGPPSDDGYVEGPKNGVAPPKVDGRRALLSSETLVPSLLLGSAQLTRLVTVGSSGGDVKNRVSATRGPRVQSKMDSATKRKVREAKIAKKKAFQGWKHSESSSSSRPQVGTHGLQLTEVEAPAKGAKLLWWVCPIPNCGFQVHRIVGQQGHSQTKDIHLRKAHGMAKAFPLTKAVSLQNTHNRLLKAREGQNLKWTAFIKTFNKRRWKGSHHIEVEPSLYKPAKIKDGSTIHVPWHKCQACGVLVNRSWLQHAPCFAVLNHGNKLPPPEKRKKVWNACQAVGKQAVKALSCSLCKGLNGQRIGEAQNPGPAHPRMITIWNQNIASWNQNGEAVLKTALDDNIQVVCFQELNLSDAALSGARNTARRSGWEMYVARQTGKRRGGVAICVREPLGVSEVKSECAAQFQFLRATVHGAASPVTVICGYRVPDEDTGFLEALNTLVQGASCHDWIVCLDGNQNQLEGPIHDLLSTERASIAAVARHNRSVHPIDAIWVCERLQVSCSSELPGLGDHSIASCTLQVSFQNGPRAWRMAKTRAYKPLDPSSGDQQGPAPQWPLSACSLDASPSVESKWRLWSQAAEEWLVLSKCVPQERSERPLGSMPKLRTAAHAAGLAQSLEERQIRRILRRFREAHVQSWRSNAVDPGLVKKLLRTPLQAEERQAVAQGRWGLAVSLAQKRLRAQLAKGQAKALTEWKHRVHSLSGAASWIKSEGPTSQCIQNAEGQVFSNRPAAAGALKDHWGTIFGVHQPADTYCEAFQQKYGDFLRPRSPGPSLPPIGAQELKASLKKMKGKAAGLDGFTPDCLLSLPETGLSQLAEVLNHCESEGQWPESLTQWRLVFLPKGKGICPSLDETRPIAISSAIYRAWGRLRLLQLSNHLARALQPWQAGGSKGVDPEVLLLATEVDFPGETYSHGVALDYRKAFDSLDYPLAIIGLRAMGVPSTVLDLLENQWKRHVRWVTFAGVTCPEPLELCAGLPQGDPWSPLGLAAVLAAPKQDAARQAPGTECLLYLDDRTLLSTTKDSLRIALDTWGELEQVSRMRTHETKTQFFCRSPNSADTADVLGASLGPSDRPLTQKELKRKGKATSVASRIALLPVSLKMRANLCATVFSPIAAWACLLNGRVPKAEELSWYTETFRRAVKGGDAKGDRSSRDLQRLLLLGHTADLSVVAACRVLKAAARWASYKLRLGQRPQRAALMSARPVKAVDASLPAPWKRSGSWGRWTNGQVSWNILAEKTEQQRAAHEVRESWRLVRLQRWLAANRNDARDARSEGLQASNALVKRLRTIAGQVDGHGVSIMCGGFAPDARWTPAGPVRDMCYSCMQPVSPHTKHVLWNCVAHAHLRTVSVPASLLAQRLGWGSLDVPVQECVRTLQVMARIRAADVAGRRKRPPWREG